MNEVTVISYYSPEELTGIGKYNGEMIEWLGRKGYVVNSFSNAPFYPNWEKYAGYRNLLYSKKVNSSGSGFDIRSWVYIPKAPTPIKKILSELSFFISNTFALALNLRRVRRSNLVIIICPPFFLGLVLIGLKGFSKFKVLHHIQDLQVDAAKELNLLPPSICAVISKVERWVLSKSDYVSTISEGMVAKIRQKNINKDILLMPNWSDLDTIKPEGSTGWLHDKFGISREKKLIVYSGNLGEKQGLEIIVEAAIELRDKDIYHFLILGEGLFRERLVKIIKHSELPNISIGGLVPLDSLNKMLNDSFIQLVVQKSSAADSFLPSKLTNILAVGCPSIVTASPNTSLYKILQEGKSAVIVEPENSSELARAIVLLGDDEDERERLKKNARQWAEDNLSIDRCLSSLLSILR